MTDNYNFKDNYLNKNTYLSQIDAQTEQSQEFPQNSKLINQNTESLFCLTKYQESIKQKIDTSIFVKCELKNTEIDLKQKNSFNLADSYADIEEDDDDTKETINSINSLKIKNFTYNSGICDTENKRNTNEISNYSTIHSQILKSKVLDSDQKQKNFIDDKEEESYDQDENQSKKSLDNSYYQKTEKSMMSSIKSSLHKTITFQDLNQKNACESNEEDFKKLLYLLQQNQVDKIKKLHYLDQFSQENLKTISKSTLKRSQTFDQNQSKII
ncbi:hypothetical protein TTHERM_00740620 (macronuclear) [Tetrahymena thermophila SB210]|uniref:Uncharacterized protein n=1 Tax=Tetrahymena thermophila (strain SB210) TaxID=312017 RepID=Q239X0_TETTS|nr:hypothetical protein TTHERM_00740620 [Tetrahymena thermophila SB210]EAR93288.3 hypothetical protein TTHERM_00740620 [Tetrahymena thermophila SB210]|eukprot:XP_001013533.3 hypothetical protein TTHERM_00740620 [Tetrahymena thermophila SB210]